VRKAGEGGVIEKIADLVKAGTLTEVPMSDDALQDPLRQGRDAASTSS